ncbi:hypothetical protein NQ317_005627 [Molorchus minor]|uniref:Uncharacterized protein n=1 Tax=Molorchus minor TaxID=1323400 RepID=A0ABQ9K8F5_9CUCU|nr:hypothetical protein NQ317_005627 [Molorchus minor]
MSIYNVTKAGPEQFLTYITIASYTGQGQGPGGAVISQLWSFSLQFGIGEIGPKRPVLEKTCKSDVKNCEISCGSGRDVAAEPVRRYVERPNRFHPTPRRFVYVIQRARDTVQIQEHRGQHAGRARRLHMLQTKEEVLDIVEDDPSTSTREIARQVNVSQDKVWKTLRENQLYPFHNNLTPGPDYTIFKCRSWYALRGN